VEGQKRGKAIPQGKRLTRKKETYREPQVILRKKSKKKKSVIKDEFAAPKERGVMRKTLPQKREACMT